MSFVKDRLMVLGWVGLCGAVSACTPEGLGGDGTGGVPTTGGTATTAGGTTTAGRASGGSAPVTGGTASGGVPSGGSPTGGKATGGTAGGGTATGGSAGTASVPMCDTVESLPASGTACNPAGVSQCDGSGHQCVCWRGIWYCSTSCASTYPAEPTPNSACTRGAACTYPSGVSCACTNGSWTCMGGGGCPATTPVTGEVCTGLTGLSCDFRNSNPALHIACFCMADSGASTASTWTCLQLGPCPATQPAYSSTTTCPGVAICSYGSTRCTCPLYGVPWICGLGGFFPSPTIEVPPAGG